MNISFAGKTRIVLIFDKKVVKIARIRFWRVAGHLVKFAFVPRFRTVFYERYGSTFGSAVWRDLFLGFDSNRNEASVDPLDHRLAPTLSSFLNGFINIQQRGEPVSAEELANNCPFDRSMFTGQVLVETKDPQQYCKIPNRGIVLADYGEPAVRNMLQV